MTAGCIHFNTNGINTTHNHIIKRILKFLLINIMLVLADTYRFRIDLDKFSKRIHQPSSD